MEIVPGLHRLRTPMTSKALPWIMPYAFEGPEGVSLFDSGYGTPEATEWLTQQLHGIGYQPSDIHRLIVSHAHPDHVGMAGWIKEQAPGCELIMLGREADWFGQMHHHHGPHRPGSDEFVDRMRGWLARHGVSTSETDEGFRRESSRHAAGDDNQDSGDVSTETQRRSWTMTDVPVDGRLADGDVLEFDGWKLLALWTPGHTPGHLCVYEPAHRLMFTGDHVLSRITPNVSLSEEDEASGRRPLEEFLASLEKVARCDTSLALPAHEDVIEDLPARCAQIREHHDHRLEEVLAGIDAGAGGAAATASEVSARVTWNKPYATFNVFKKRSALGETLAHLQLLEVHGRIRRIEDASGADVVVRWERTGR